MADSFSKTFPIASVYGQAAVDAWLYGHAFHFENNRYKITSYYVAGESPLVVVVTLTPWSESGSPIPEPKS